MASSLPRWRRVAAISYGYIGLSTSRLSSDSASRLLIFRRPVFRSWAIPHLLVSESPLPRTRSQVLVDEYRHERASPATLCSERSAVSRGDTTMTCALSRSRFRYLGAIRYGSRY